MAAHARSAIFTVFKVVQRVVGWAFLLVMLGFLLLFFLQFRHPPKLEALKLIIHLRQVGDPIIAECASWIGSSWPARGTSFLPLVLAFAVWLAKIGVDAFFNWTARTLGKRMPPPSTAEVLPELASLGGVPADSERSRDLLLKRYREIEDALKSARRKRCAFLSVDVVGSTQMKTGEEDTAITVTFKAWEETLNATFEQHGAWKLAWTPDGVMVCFLQLDLAIAAGQRALASLKQFNHSRNKLRTSFRVRCGLSEGEVAIYEDSKLEKIADHVIDVAGHMQKQARPNTLWVSSEVYGLMGDKSGFRKTKHEVDGFAVYEWSAEPVQDVGEATEVIAAAHAPRAVRTPPSPTGERGALRIGRYEVSGELGRGAMGAVYRARDPQIGRTVAIKMILVGSQDEEALEEYKKRFYREAQTAGQMSHPGIVTIYDVAEDEGGQPYLVMEFVEGTTLEKLVAPGKSGGEARPRSLPLQELLGISVQVADALDYAHRRNVIHRDIKPANILVTPEGKAKIADFGIAKMEGTQMTQTGLLVGTPAFMSPEQVAGGKVDTRSDIFSFGIVLYWMFTGQRPFSGSAITEVAYKVVHADPTPPRQLNAQLPPALETVVSRCLAKKPAERYPSARDLVADLEAVRAAFVAAAAPAPFAPKTAG